MLKNVDSSKSKRATEEDKQMILECYNQTNSIEKTAKITKWSKITVNKYVRGISSQKPMSRDFKGIIIQKDLDGSIINEFKNITIAEKQTGIKQSNICQNITGTTKSAGGYIWERKELK